MLEAYHHPADVAKAVIPFGEFHPFPRWGEESGLSPELKSLLIARGEKHLGYQWPLVPATAYMAYCRNGSRTVYETPRYARRIALVALMEAEWAEGKGRFLNDIIDGLWIIMEEMTWVNSAHNTIMKVEETAWGPMVRNVGQERNPLPDPDAPEIIDLFSAATGGLLSMAYHLLKKPLGDASPLLLRHLEKRINERILTPFLTYYYGWSGLTGHASNWTAWILSNVLTAFAFACPDENRRAQGIARCCTLLENYDRDVGPDGGCDEGPMYWNHAVGNFFGALTLLSRLTNGQSDGCFQSEKLANMGRYIYRTHAAGAYFTNYADAPMVFTADPAMLCRFGQAIGDAPLVDFAAAYPKEAGVEAWRRSFTFDREQGEIKLHEQALFAGEANQVSLTFLTPTQPEMRQDSLLFRPETGHALCMTLPKGLEAQVQEVSLGGDERLMNSWGKALWRVCLQASCGKEMALSFTMKKA